MKKKLLFIIWGGLFALCAALGFIPNPEGALRILLILLALLCFVPPLVLIRQGEKPVLRLIRNLSLLWLGLTLTLICLNILSASGSLAAGNLLYRLLVIVSSPMICGQYWIISLFGWAYLLFDAIQALRKG